MGECGLISTPKHPAFGPINVYSKEGTGDIRPGDSNSQISRQLPDPFPGKYNCSYEVSAKSEIGSTQESHIHIISTPAYTTSFSLLRPFRRLELSLGWLGQHSSTLHLRGTKLSGSGSFRAHATIGWFTTLWGVSNGSGGSLRIQKRWSKIDPAYPADEDREIGISRIRRGSISQDANSIDTVGGTDFIGHFIEYDISDLKAGDGIIITSGMFLEAEITALESEVEIVMLIDAKNIFFAACLQPG